MGNIRWDGTRLLYDVINGGEFHVELFRKLAGATTVNSYCNATRTNRITVRTAYGSVTNLASRDYSNCVVLDAPADLHDIPVSIPPDAEALAAEIVDQLCGQVVQGPPVRLDWGRSVVDFGTNRVVVSETNGWIQLPLRRTSQGGSLPAVAAISLGVRVEGTGAAGVDYLPPARATIGMKGSTNNLPFRILDDMVFGGDKTLTLTLDPMGSPNVVIGANASITVVVVDNDRPVPVPFVLETAPSNVVALPDGRILVAGSFESVGGVRRPHLARLTRDLALDTGFSPPAYVETNTVLRVEPLSDGSILTLQSGSQRLGRIGADGAVDPAFWALGSTDASISGMRADGDGGVYTTGYFYTESDASARSVTRLDRSGAPDPEFSANLVGLSPKSESRRGISGYPDGRLVVSGDFPDAKQGRYGILRLLPDGQPDPTPQAQGGFSNTVSVVKVDPLGRVLVGGKFKQFRTNAAPGWVRLLEDGNWDSTFAPTLDGSAISSLEVMRDGRIAALDGTILRLFADGGASLGTLASNVTTFALEPAGTILVGSTDFPHLWRVSLGNPLAPEVGFLRGHLGVRESASSVVLKLIRTGNPQPTVEVDYRVPAPLPSLGLDPAAMSGTVRFGPGQSEAEILLPLKAADSGSVEDRRFSVQLVGARGAMLTAGRDITAVEVRDEDAGLDAEVFSYQSANRPGSLPNSTRGTLQSSGVAFWDRRELHRDRVVFFEWGYGGGPSGVPTDEFAVIWSGWVLPEVSGTYQFAVLANDGARIWVDNTVIMDEWHDGFQSQLISSEVQLKASTPSRFYLHFHEKTLSATCRLAWKPPGSTNWVTVPRRVLRPGNPRGTPPTLAISMQEDRRLRFDVTGEPGRPVRIESSTNDGTWSPIAEVNHSGTRITNTVIMNGYTASTLPVGARVRAVSVDGGIADTGYVVPLVPYLGVLGRTNLVEGSMESVALLAASNGGDSQVIRWWRNGIPTTNGVVGARLTLTGVDPDMVGEYHFTLDAGGRHAESRRVKIGFAQKPGIGPTSDLTLQAGAPAVLRMAVTGTEPLAYAWSRDGNPVPYGTNATLTLTRVSEADAGWYVLSVTNLLGQATSGVMAVRVVPPGSFVPSVRLDQGQVVAEVPANPGPYDWQESRDLKSWFTLLRVEVSSSPFVFTSGVTSQDPSRFYRLLPAR